MFITFISFLKKCSYLISLKNFSCKINIKFKNNTQNTHNTYYLLYQMKRSRWNRFLLISSIF